MKDLYFRKVLGKILQGRQSAVEELINIHLAQGKEETGYDNESLDEMIISDAINLLADLWEYLQPAYR